MIQCGRIGFGEFLPAKMTLLFSFIDFAEIGAGEYARHRPFPSKTQSVPHSHVGAAIFFVFFGLPVRYPPSASVLFSFGGLSVFFRIGLGDLACSSIDDTLAASPGTDQALVNVAVNAGLASEIAFELSRASLGSSDNRPIIKYDQLRYLAAQSTVVIS